MAKTFIDITALAKKAGLTLTVSVSMNLNGGPLQPSITATPSSSRTSPRRSDGGTDTSEDGMPKAEDADRLDNRGTTAVRVRERRLGPAGVDLAIPEGREADHDVPGRVRAYFRGLRSCAPNLGSAHRFTGPTGAARPSPSPGEAMTPSPPRTPISVSVPIANTTSCLKEGTYASETVTSERPVLSYYHALARIFGSTGATPDPVSELAKLGLAQHDPFPHTSDYSTKSDGTVHYPRHGSIAERLGVLWNSFLIA